MATLKAHSRPIIGAAKESGDVSATHGLLADRYGARRFFIGHGAAGGRGTSACGCNRSAVVDAINWASIMTSPCGWP
jgi:hypothetical protein